MIEDSKLSMQSFCRLVVSSGGFFWSIEVAHCDLPAIRINGGSPSFLVSAYALVSRLIVNLRASISSVLDGGAFPKVLSPIVKSVSVFVISNLSIFKTKYESMHPDHLGFASPCRIVLSFLGMPFCAPIRLHEPIEVTGINNGGLPLREGNVSVVFCKWLSNRVPFKRRSGHFLSPNRTCYSAILAL